jgi:hydroxyacylglutathione hydrolase
MHFKQFYVGCLAHASYLIGDGGEAVVVDPARDIQMYLDEAERHGLRITAVLETHLHADFVSGHRDLGTRTGAWIGIGARAEAGYAHRALCEGDAVCVGDVRIVAVETPGHTPESLSFLVYDHAADPEPWGVLTGDTLFVGDVGRVDILSSRLPVQELAGLMHDSLGKLMRLPDATRVFPAHGAGSLCGRSISSDSSSTIGRERLLNVALQPASREAFIADITRDVPETPVYFLHSRDLNRAGPPLASDRALPEPLTPAEVEARVRAGAVLLDTRDTAAYAAGHVPGALHVSLDGQYASWVGTLVTPDEALILVVGEGRLEEAVMRLARVGYENVAGVLEFARWRNEGRDVIRTPQPMATDVMASGRRLLDVRRAREYAAGHLEGAVHIPLSQLPSRAAELDRAVPWAVVCASGYRSSIATSVLERAGFRDVANAAGGMDAVRRAGLPVVEGAPA